MKGMESFLHEFIHSHPLFQEKNLLKTRLALSQEILERELEEERRAWFLHRLSYAHTPDELSDLIAQVLC